MTLRAILPNLLPAILTIYYSTPIPPKTVKNHTPCVYNTSESIRGLPGFWDTSTRLTDRVRSEKYTV